MSRPCRGQNPFPQLATPPTALLAFHQWPDEMMEVMMVGGPFDKQIYEVPPCSSITIPMSTAVTVDVPIRVIGGRYIAVWDKRTARSIT